ncbi:MAG: DUF1064 domain-containing protein [Patescibacteria group bacterium]|nr:DUF1064 domain-containing protein [Patescibacteria group bacterium]
MHLVKYRYNKFNNVKTAGYDSKFEAGYAQELELRKKAKDIKDWEAQKRIELRVNGELITTYKIDFVVYHNDKTIEYVETKGYETYDWRLRWKLFVANFKKEIERGEVICTVEKQLSNWNYFKKYKSKK